jgi:hypothetical protein
MNFWLKGNVTIPARPHTVGGLIGWARGVNRALTELRDRKIEGKVAKGKGVKPYPFQVSATPDLLKSTPGLLGLVSIASIEEEDPADGVWYLFAKVIIDSTTGAITSSTVEWILTTVPEDTTTNYHLTIARVTISDGAVSLDPAETAQYTYGPISVVVGGGQDSKYAVRLL